MEPHMAPYWWAFALLTRSLYVLPWLAGVGLAIAMVSYSRLGRALLRHLREAKQDAALNEAMLSELAALRDTITEVVERLDATEQHLARQARVLPESSPPAATPPPELRDADRTPTPV
jgi:hypothetical protein